MLLKCSDEAPKVEHPRQRQSPKGLVRHHTGILESPFVQDGFTVREQDVPFRIAIFFVNAGDGIMGSAVTLLERFLSQLERFGTNVLSWLVAGV